MYRLEHLDLGHFRGLTVAGLESVALEELVHLDLSGCATITDASLVRCLVWQDHCYWTYAKLKHAYAEADEIVCDCLFFFLLSGTDPPSWKRSTQRLDELRMKRLKPLVNSAHSHSHDLGGVVLQTVTQTTIFFEVYFLLWDKGSEWCNN